jgi:hypothetical protein
MTSLDQIKNMTWYLRGAISERRALLGRLLELDEDIARVQYELDEAWASQFEQPAEQVEDDSGDKYDEEECSLRKRKTKKIGKGKLSLDYRDKKRVKEARARKRTKRSHTQLKGERDYGVNVVREMESEIGFREACDDREEQDQQHDQSEPESEHSDDIRSFCDNCTRGHCICDEIEESAGFTRGRHDKYIYKECHEIPFRYMCGYTDDETDAASETDSAWMERMNSEVLRLTALW